MNGFAKALVAAGKSDSIPEQDNLFGPLVGSWEFEWIDHRGADRKRRIPGEWLFSWVLDGTAVQDVFICPSRAQRNPQSAGEYGTTLRIYNADTRAWDVFYGCAGDEIRLEARKDGPTILLEDVETGTMRWVFSDISADSFHWERREKKADGGWVVVGELNARRKRRW